MRYSKLFGKTSKSAPSDADSANARLLEQAGYVDQLMAGVYTYLPLGLRVLDNIKNIVREEMVSLGSQEILMPALTPKEPWAVSGRWTDPGPEVMFQFKGRGEKDFALGWTHEEIVTPLAKKMIRSYRDLPLSVFQIQDKFRNEPRAKSGLLRGRGGDTYLPFEQRWAPMEWTALIYAAAYAWVALAPLAATSQAALRRFVRDGWVGSAAIFGASWSCP